VDAVVLAGMDTLVEPLPELSVVMDATVLPLRVTV